MQLSKEALFFQSVEGSIILYGNSWGRPLLFSPDGQTFFELNQTGFGGTSEEHDISFEDPHSNKKGRFYRKGDELEMDGKVYKKVDGRSEVEVVPLPTIRQPEYLFGAPDGNYIYVSADKFRYSYESFKLFIGGGEKMREVSIKHVDRYRDGGTTNIETAEGVLYSPTPFRSDAVATWQGDVKLTKLDPTQFHIVETESGVQLQRN
ncbi:MAG: hypothetical protein G01um101419_130 [Parcubacteria group bacterium Gr01-1014_19]|nr:MAG: hypothetical protein G01um101419_130 [Parcubacteria group bacterium Gr01-1014_19]